MSSSKKQHDIGELRRFMARVYQADPKVDQVELSKVTVSSDTYGTVAAVIATVKKRDVGPHQSNNPKSDRRFNELFDQPNYEWERVIVVEGEDEYQYTVHLPIAEDTELDNIRYPSS